MFNVGRLWRSSSRSATFSDCEKPNVSIKRRRDVRNLFDRLPLLRRQRRHVVVEPVDRSTRPPSSFIEASSLASASAGFGAQLP